LSFAVVTNLLFQTDDIQTFWHGARCDFTKRQTGVISKV